MLVFIYNTDKTSEIDLFNDEDKNICLQMVHDARINKTIQGAYCLRVDYIVTQDNLQSLHKMREKAQSPGIFASKIATRSHAWGYSQRLEEHNVKPWE